jgi:hypothetical protein
VRGITEQNHATPVPVPDRIAVADCLAPAEVEHGQERLHRRMRVAEGVLKLGAVGRDVATLGMG